MNTILWQRIEGMLVFVAAVSMLLPYIDSWPYAVLLLVFFAPDLSFIAYLAGPRIGAMAYNAVHLYGFGAALFAVGMIGDINRLTVLGLLWLGHAGFDRALGYGLKEEGAFTQTHLGPIGKKS